MSHSCQPLSEFRVPLILNHPFHRISRSFLLAITLENILAHNAALAVNRKELGELF
jgi:hypothetical protein